MFRNLPAISLLGIVLATADAVGAQTGPLEWQFDVSLDGKPIGSHSFELRQEGDNRVLTTEATFDVKFLFFTAFRYRHRTTEVWDDGCLVTIDAETNSNGKRLEVTGERTDDGFAVQTSDSASTLPECIKSFAYWNPAVLTEARLLNSQTGVYEDVEAEYEGVDEVRVADRTVSADRYRLSAKAGDITLWYSRDDNTWVGLEAPAKGGRRLRYEAASVPDPDFPAPTLARSE